MRALALGALVAALAGLAAFIERAGRGARINRRFAFFTLSLALWILGILGLNTGLALEFWGRVAFAGGSLGPAGFLAFVRVYPTALSWPRAAIARSLISFGIALACIAVTSDMLVRDVQFVDDTLTRKPGVLYPVFVIYFLTTWSTALLALVRQRQRGRGRARAQLNFLLVGMLIVTLGAATTNVVLPWLTGRSTYGVLGPFFVLPLILLVGHAIIRVRLMDLRVTFGRGFFLAVAAGVISVIVTLSLRVWGQWNNVAFPAPIVAGAIVLVIGLSAPVAPLLLALVDRYLQRGRPDLDAELASAARRFAQRLGFAQVLKELEGIITSVLAPEWIVTAWRNGDGAVHSQAIGLVDDVDVSSVVNASSHHDGSIAPPVRVLARGSAMDRDFTASETAALNIGAEVRIALGAGSNYSALLFLGPRRNGDAYLASTLQFIDGLSELASMALETASIHDRELRVAREADRVAHLSDMARSYAALGHEIRTPLTTISNLVSAMPDRLNDSEYRDLLVRLVPTEINRIVGLSERLRALVPEGDIQRNPVDLCGVVADVVALLSTTAEAAGVHLAVDTPAHTCFVRGQRDPLVQLMQNLLRNAMEASPRDTNVTVKVSRVNGAPVLIVSDEGPGISPTVKARLFEPFASTKGEGRGLGLSICHEIVQRHGATLTLTPRRDRRGTLARVAFPPYEGFENGHT